VFVPSDATWRSGSSGQSVNCPRAKQVLAGHILLLNNPEFVDRC
jgi:hypothetical protein